MGRESIKGYTLIELVLTLILLGILLAVALPSFMDMKKDAKNAATLGSIGGIRAAVGIARATIALREDIGVPVYPKSGEMQANQYHGAYHPVLSGQYIMDPSTGFPKNPWTLATLPESHFRSVVDCTSLSKGILNSVSGSDLRGWCYNETSGEAWANSAFNGDSETENRY